MSQWGPREVGIALGALGGGVLKSGARRGPETGVSLVTTVRRLGSVERGEKPNQEVGTGLTPHQPHSERNTEGGREE